MTAKLGRTPRRRSFAERAVLHFLPADEGPEIVGDLEEARHARFPAGGLRSSVWYWTHGTMLAMSFIVEHARERFSLRQKRSRMRGPHHNRSGGPLMEGVRQDLVHAIRLASKRPGFAVAVVFTLALGIGVNTAVFDLINTVVLRPLPYAESERLFTLIERDSVGTGLRVPSYPTAAD